MAAAASLGRYSSGYVSLVNWRNESEGEVLEVCITLLVRVYSVSAVTIHIINKDSHIDSWIRLALLSAATRLMSLQGGKVQFLEWETGMRRVRYLYICPPSSFQLQDVQTAEDNKIPVFLGRDVVSQTGMGTGNYSKIHAKFAKKGLATRLNFSTAFKFEKLRLRGGLNSIWFYSIQGLFKVAFDLYNREEQLAVIESLHELWKSRFKDELLNKCYDLSICLENNKCVVPVFNQTGEPETHETLAVSSSRQVSGILRVSCCLSEQDYYMTSQDGSSVCPSQDIAGNELIIQRMQSLLGMCSVINLENNLVPTVLALFDVVGQVFSGHDFFDKMINSIMDLLEVVSHLKDQDNPQEVSNLYDNQLLFEVSSWLGNRFHSENDRISLQVEEFKRKHIDHISDLAHAEELVAALFPNAMKVLLLKWMGLFDDVAETKLQREYPILLLILEFANHNLITGVSHVLYATLIFKKKILCHASFCAF